MWCCEMSYCMKIMLTVKNALGLFYWEFGSGQDCFSGAHTTVEAVALF